MKINLPTQTIVLTILSMLAFAGNSLLCRIALKHTAIDPIHFSSIRIISGALILWLIIRLRGGTPGKAGNWFSTLALFGYAVGFSLAYVNLSAGTGALLLFGAVQITMISYGLWTGERLKRLQVTGLIVATTGLFSLLLPGLSTPPIQSALLMLGAGIAWGIYSLLGKRAADPIYATGGNFLRAVPLTLTLSLLSRSNLTWDSTGVGYAILSGAITSAVGYAIWYTALRGLNATQAATVQLSVPVIAAVGAVLFLSEPLTLRLIISSIAVLGGIALVIYQRRNVENPMVLRKSLSLNILSGQDRSGFR